MLNQGNSEESFSFFYQLLSDGNANFFSFHYLRLSAAPNQNIDTLLLIVSVVIRKRHAKIAYL